MIAREHLATAHAPDGQELRLYAHDRDFMILLKRDELMSTRMRGSEEALATDARVIVTELVPEIVEWARGPMASLTAASLDDPRVELRIGDVAEAIAWDTAGWDAILLDVDNGPDGLVRPANDRLYSAAGLAAARRALRPGGILAVWSAAPDAGFTRRLRAAGFAVEETVVSARPNRKGPRHVIWFARKP